MLALRVPAPQPLASVAIPALCHYLRHPSFNSLPMRESTPIVLSLSLETMDPVADPQSATTMLVLATGGSAAAAVWVPATVLALPLPKGL